jgi:hypothetical protein
VIVEPFQKRSDLLGKFRIYLSEIAKETSFLSRGHRHGRDFITFKDSSVTKEFALSVILFFSPCGAKHVKASA